MSNRLPITVRIVAIAVGSVLGLTIGLAGFAAGLIGTAGPAAAHARLLSSDPADGARLDARPGAVSLRFGEPIDARSVRARVEVAVDDAETTYEPQPRVEGDQVLVPLEDVTSDGSYTVTYRVVSEDGHPVEGTVRFRVVAPADPDGEGDPDADGDPDGDGDPEGGGDPDGDGVTPTPTPGTTDPGIAEPAGDDDGSPPWLLLGAGLAVLVAAGAAVTLAARRRTTPPAP